MKQNIGRSMVEMLGVLAVIGVLSIAAVAGFKLAMTYHKANETIHDVMLRATNVPMKWDDYDSKVDYKYPFPELYPEEQNPVNYHVETWAEPASSAYVYRVEVTDMPNEVCRRIVGMEPTSISLYKAGTTINRNKPNAVKDDCGTGTTNMYFFFEADWFDPEHTPNTDPENPKPGKVCTSDTSCGAGECCKNGACTTDCQCENLTCGACQTPNYATCSCDIIPDCRCENLTCGVCQTPNYTTCSCDGDADPCCGSTDECCGSDDPCACNPNSPCCLNPTSCACQPNNKCCDSTDPCCGSTDECCGNADPCACNPTSPCCTAPNSCACQPNNKCCDSTDPCCGSTDECCGNADPCACNPNSPCCLNPTSCACQPNNKCCDSTDPCCGSTDECCGNADPCACNPTSPCCTAPNSCACQPNNKCCDSTDPCCGSTDECCGSDDPCACNPNSPCCTAPNSCACQPNNKCCDSTDPCCGSTDECCGNADPCACNPNSPCCLNPTSCACQPNNKCCDSTDPCCGLNGSALTCCQSGLSCGKCQTADYSTCSCIAVESCPCQTSSDCSEDSKCEGSVCVPKTCEEKGGAMITVFTGYCCTTETTCCSVDEGCQTACLADSSCPAGACSSADGSSVSSSTCSAGDTYGLWITGVTGAPNLSSICCGQCGKGSRPDAYWTGSSAQCCYGEVSGVTYNEEKKYLCCDRGKKAAVSEWGGVECCTSNKIYAREDGAKGCCPSEEGYSDTYPTDVEGTSYQICCDKNQTAYIATYGSYSYAACCDGQTYKEGTSSGLVTGCCRTNTGAYFLDKNPIGGCQTGVQYCGTEPYGYCRHDENGYRAMGCDQPPQVVDGKAICCNEGEIAYKQESGSLSCCPGELYTYRNYDSSGPYTGCCRTGSQVIASGIPGNCQAGVQFCGTEPYAHCRYDENGYRAIGCNQPPQVVDGKAICCNAGAKAACAILWWGTRWEYGCSCCSGTWQAVELYDGTIGYNCVT